MGQGRAKVFRKCQGFFGEGDDFNFGVFWGFIPKNPRKIFGDYLGTGMTSISVFFWILSPKIPKNFLGFFGDRDDFNFWIFGVLEKIFGNFLGGC